ncbi:zinc finger BED domain-containing protein RICESLEEPER 2-like [Tripterygium wilfordii]|uniref:zinc finger BED domain-containing protein RICESLEEPER 2-like n=1 Tax=Tripterygium wilfordii TaxID=458696 RepID=UPI0018F84252|nr:zinc finger BED domain-containing protein RICESLEEPER 2-like [Tripterygium wilfordii]
MVDNAPTNDGVVDWTKKYGSKHVLGGNYLRVGGFAYFLNLVVKQGLQKCVKSIEKTSNAVKYVRSSLKRQSKFLDCAKQLGVMITKSVCLDVVTQWNSTYLMLEVAVEYELVFDCLYHEDLGYHGSFLTTNVLGSPGFNDWENARKLIPFLKLFYDGTTTLSGSTYVTINNYFFWIQAIRDYLKEAQTSNYKVLSEVVVDMMSKYDQYFGNISKVNMLVYIALVLDPRKTPESQSHVAHSSQRSNTNPSSSS